MHRHLMSLAWLKISILFALSGLAGAAFAAGEITAARVWPAQEYTRIAFELNTKVKHQLLVLKNPERLVIDIENLQINGVLKSLSDKVLASDPYIKQVRVSQFKPSVVRLVIDLKKEIKPNIFILPPAGDYKHRLVLDIFPLQDPLAQIVAQREKTPQQTAPVAVEEKPVSDENSGVVVDENQPKPIIEPLPPEVMQPDTEENPQRETPVFKDEETKKATKTFTIAVDAGHGGEDPGAKGANGSREKFITLAIAKKLKAKIEENDNMRAVLIRDGDYFVPLLDRVLKARKVKADLFISIHADAFTTPQARGSSVFAVSEKGATSASARYLAKKENESDLIGGVNLDKKDPLLAKTLLDLSQTATINDSLKLGKLVLSQVGQVNKLHKNKVEQAGFAVLKSPDIPSILVETAFISNPDEERKLNEDAYQDRLVNAIFAGVQQYFNQAAAVKR